MIKKFLILVTLIPSILTAGVSDTQQEFLKGRQLLDQGQAGEALEIFREVLEEDPLNLLLNLYMGRAAFQAKDYEEALFAFERALILDPSNAVALLEKARTLIAMGQKESAKAALKAALALELPERVRSNANELLEALDFKSAKEPLPECYADTTFILGVTADSNATVGTGPVPLPFDPGFIVDASERSDNIWFWSAIAQYQRPTLCPFWFWHVGGVVHVSDYERIHENDLMLYSLLGGFRYIRAKHFLDIAFSWIPIDLDGRLYQNHRRLSFYYQGACSEYVQLKANISHTWRHHYATTGSGIDNTQGYVNESFAQLRRTVFSKRLFLYGEVGHRYDQSPRDNYPALSYHRTRLSGGVIWDYTDTVHWDIALHWRRDKYQQMHQIFTDKVREDRYLAETVLLSLKLCQAITAQFYLEHVENRSNIPLNQYRTDRGSFIILLHLT